MNDKDYMKVAKEYLGNSAICHCNVDVATDSICDELSIYGERALCDYVINGEINEIKFQFSYLIEIYKSERRKKISHWEFVGCVLKIEDKEIKNTVLGYCGKVFKRIISHEMVKNRKIRDLRVYSFDERVSNETEQQVRQYRKWIEDELCYYFSCVYAICMRPGSVQIIFWKPDLNSVEDNLDFIKRVLGKK